jgi:hypothetical protein
MQQLLKLYCLTSIYSSTYFGRHHAHHQELNNCSSSLWFYLRSVVIAVLLVVVGPAGDGLKANNVNGQVGTWGTEVIRKET